MASATAPKNSNALSVFRNASLPLCVFFMFVFSLPAFSNQLDSINIDLAQMRFYQSLRNRSGIAVVPVSLPSQSIPSLYFAKFNPVTPHVEDSTIEKSIVLQFILTNATDSIRQVFFFPGYLCPDISIFQASPADVAGTFREVGKKPGDTVYAGARLLTLLPHETAMFFARFRFVRSNTNSLSPRIIESDYLPQLLKSIKERDYMQDIITYIISGVMLLMIFYSLAVFLQNRKVEFIYYSCYTFCTAVLLFLKSFLSLDNSRFNFIFEAYLDFMILCLGVFFYLIFVRKFLNTKEQHPFLENFLKVSEILILVFIAIFSMVFFLTDYYVILNILENYVIKLLLLVIGITFIVYSIKKKDALLNYLAAGNLALVLFSIVSLIMMTQRLFLVTAHPGSMLNRSLFYYEVGLVLELLFFLSGLAYKNRRDLIEQVKERERLKLETERKEFENKMAIVTAKQQERNRISADMHDELGSGVTAIRLMSEIVKSKMKEQTLPEIEKISHSADELLGKMNTIIWTMKSSNDSLESLAAYIRSHALEYFDGTMIDCTVHVSVEKDIEMSGDVRRNIFLSVKEALTNILKHAHATNVVIDISMHTDHLIIRVSDNGVGIDSAKLRRFGNGMNNMKKRMQGLNGDLVIESSNGTTLTMIVPVQPI
jgi:signal transduction histidine kinase